MQTKKANTIHGDEKAEMIGQKKLQTMPAKNATNNTDKKKRHKHVANMFTCIACLCPVLFASTAHLPPVLFTSTVCLRPVLFTSTAYLCPILFTSIAHLYPILFTSIVHHSPFHLSTLPLLGR